ncbi:hypothetical protein VOLCADRAFT_88215 [Volvox carteri f. nagariensis]|uniref:Uncharacterized protein n=1 Tax=Volvox carteri f. nagariensis TaxID=3068 RepID=D8TNL0_VOLCA|nr:uncharacterized protein VOLCADRAFT_88215 [Volvox carteri f. nagariensis]EFJ50862.1 hypothetical protein VOLCADRAFT_88215 [Volvox carteri f. nagariensis]|eukprot:XP_002947874.1 hypothetical protein VOLCADRAFT_88215 [Volvox carteri f. nagariensis]
MVSAQYITSPGPAPTFQNGKSDVDGGALDEWGDAAQAYLAINSPGYSYDRALLKSPKAEPAFTSLPTGAAADFGYQPAGYSDHTPQPLVSIQLADEDEDSHTPLGSSKSKGNIYRRVWGSGPSPILQRQIQRYSLRNKLNKSLGDRSSIADSPGNAAYKAPETRLPRVAYLTPGTKIPAPGSPLAYRTTASSPGPNPLTPSSALKQSPAAGSGHKAIQYQPRGLAVIRHMAAASTNSSGAWPGTSPARSDVVAKPSPTMARTLDGLLLAEDIVAALVAAAVEMAENGAKQSARSNGGTARPLRQKLAVVSEGDRADVASEYGDGKGPDCRCHVM